MTMLARDPSALISRSEDDYFTRHSRAAEKLFYVSSGSRTNGGLDVIRRLRFVRANQRFLESAKRQNPGGDASGSPVVSS
jgi:hypothetical protein